MYTNNMYTIKNIGDLIKYERIRQNMKQITLCKGICSPSYLSKIENNSADPSPELISLLLKRLNINPEEYRIQKESEFEFLKELDEIYKETVINRDKNFAREKLDYLTGTTFYYTGETLFQLILVIAKLYLSLDELEPIRGKIEFLYSKSSGLSKKQRYLLHKIEGIYYYKLKNHGKALAKLMKADKLLNELNVPAWERADLHYCLGLAFAVLGQTYNAIENTKKSLDSFKDYFLYNRAIDCYILLGICYNRMKLHREALEIYDLALKIINDLNLEGLKGKIFHNLGSIYSFLDPKKSIEYFEKSLHLKKSTSDKLASVLSIIEEYSKANHWKKVKEWIKEGERFIECHPDNFNSFRHHFAIYKELSGKQYVTDKTVTSAIEHFEREGSYDACYKYSLMLADSLFKRGKYKLSALHYKKAHHYYLKSGGGVL
jgi:Helix-turn-helix.